MKIVGISPLVNQPGLPGQPGSYEQALRYKMAKVLLQVCNGRGILA